MGALTVVVGGWLDNDDIAIVFKNSEHPATTTHVCVWLAEAMLGYNLKFGWQWSELPEMSESLFRAITIIGKRFTFGHFKGTVIGNRLF